MNRKGKVNRTWTSAEEAFLITSHSSLLIREQAKALSRDPKDVADKRSRMSRKGLLSSHDRGYLPTWSPEADEWLRDNYHRYTMKTLVRKLGRTETAIILRKKRLGIVRSDGFYTCRALAEVFGCDSKNVAAFYHEGYLKGKRAPYLQGRHRPWVFVDGPIGEFIRTYPWLLRPAKMKEEHYFRSLVRNEWERDPWYTTQEAASLMGVADNTLLKRFNSGEIPAFQRSPEDRFSYWWVRRSALLEHFRCHDTREERSRNMANMQRSRRERSGLPRRIAVVWEMVCQDCAERYTVEASPRAWSPEVLELAKVQHQCAAEVVAA